MTKPLKLICGDDNFDRGGPRRADTIPNWLSFKVAKALNDGYELAQSVISIDAYLGGNVTQLKTLLPRAQNLIETCKDWQQAAKQEVVGEGTLGTVNGSHFKRVDIVLQRMDTRTFLAQHFANFDACLDLLNKLAAQSPEPSNIQEKK